MPVLIEISMGNVFERLPMFPSESKVWIVVYGEETISGALDDKILGGIMFESDIETRWS